MDILQLMTKVPSFEGLPRNQVEKILSIAINRVFKRGEMVFFEGDSGDGFYVVLSGKVRVYKNSAGGKEVNLHICGVGDQIGQIVAYKDTGFPANAQVLDDSELIFFSREKFLSLIGKYPSLALNMLAVLSEKLRELTSQVESLALKDVPARLASYLLSLEREKDTVTLDISKSQLSCLLGTRPETFSRIFKDLSDRGLISHDGSKICLLDVEKLQALSKKGSL